MKYKSLKPNYEDERGKIMDLVTHENFQHATIITSNKDSFRGDHYHKLTSQYTFLISGELQYISRDRKSKKVNITTMHSNDIILSPPNEEHGFLAITNSLILVLTSGPRGGEEYESDTYRLPKEDSLLQTISNEV